MFFRHDIDSFQFLQMPHIDITLALYGEFSEENPSP